jgi:tetratricopeptide (TPR) repeat protein
MGFALANESNALEGVARGNKVLCDSLASEGSKLQEEKRYAEAIAKYEQAHSADPRQLYVMNALGNCFQKLNDQKSAEKWYLKSLRTDINQPPVWDWLKSTGSTATLDDSGTQRKSLSAPTLVVADLTFSTDGGATWTADPPILSGTNRKFKVKAEWAGGDSRCGGVQLKSSLESTNGKERYDHVDFKRAYYYAYRHLHQTPRPYIFDMDLSGRNPGTYKYRFRVWYNINEPDPTLPGEDKRRVEANRAFSVLIRK